MNGFRMRLRPGDEIKRIPYLRIEYFPDVSSSTQQYQNEFDYFLHTRDSNFPVLDFSHTIS